MKLGAVTVGQVYLDEEKNELAVLPDVHQACQIQFCKSRGRLRQLQRIRLKRVNLIVASSRNNNTRAETHQ